ncbi:hypothetical protein AAZV13_08G141800 [Glycine max]
MKLVWSPESALKSYVDTVKSVRTFNIMNHIINNFLSLASSFSFILSLSLSFPLDMHK